MLTAAKVKTASPGTYGDGRGGFGLILVVRQATGGRVGRRWVQRVRIDGRPTNVGLGGFPRVTLAEAREKALANVRLIDTGADPRVKVMAPAVPTFLEAMERAIEVLRVGWKDGSRTEAQMRKSLSDHAMPTIGRKPIDAITPAQVLAFVTPLALAKPATAEKLKGYLSHLFAWAVSQGLRDDNPASAKIGRALPKRQPKHHEALPWKDVPGAIEAIRVSGERLVCRLALEMLILTATRSGEVRAAEWKEFDLEAATWTIPASRMKSGWEHRIPLSDPALAVLEQARALDDGSGRVFPGAKGKEMGNRALSDVLKDAGIDVVPHGFRASFRNWAAEHRIDRQTAESALAHNVGDATERSYLTSDFFDLRREAMERWAEAIS